MSFNSYKEFSDHVKKKYGRYPAWDAKLAWDHQQEIINVLRANLKVNTPPSAFHIWARIDIFGDVKFYTTKEVEEAMVKIHQSKHHTLDTGFHGVEGRIEDFPCKEIPLSPPVACVLGVPTPLFIIGSVYQSATHGPVQFKGMDTYRGETSYNFWSPSGREDHYWLPEALWRHFPKPKEKCPEPGCGHELIMTPWGMDCPSAAQHMAAKDYPNM